MLTPEERICLIRKRTAEIRIQKIKEKQHILDFCCIAVCMLLIAGIGTFMPDFTGSNVLHVSGAASLVADNTALGYILMGLLAFLLGVSVTVLLFRLRHRRERIKVEEDNEF